jgi:hypothetical protein
LSVREGEQTGGQMSRSYKKVPIVGNIGCKSEKKDKSIANRMERRIVKNYINSGYDVLPDKRSIFNLYDMNKDGKNYNHNVEPKEMRK